ncbi:MAG: DUF368 domain-containing protein [Phycisphaerales bacterium]
MSAPPPDTSDASNPVPAGPLAVRGTLGGILMGLANLVPGISGGTMLLAAGVYPAFIEAVADVSSLRFSRRAILLLACVAGAAAAAIVLLAGPMRDLVVHHRWIMYSLFIGLTLGGVPLILNMVKPVRADVVVSALIGTALMAAMAFVQPASGGAAGGDHRYVMYVITGIAGAAAMVLPGVSGGYLILLLGMYVPLLGAIDELKSGLKARDTAALLETMHVVVPVGIGVVIGIAGISSLMRWLLARAPRPTLGLLLGLLLGAIFGLWPFQAGVAPVAGSDYRGDTIVLRDGTPWLESADEALAAEDWPTAFFRPTPIQIAGSLGLIVAGAAISLGIARLGREKPARG